LLLLYARICFSCTNVTYTYKLFNFLYFIILHINTRKADIIFWI
jgi:hypothetical protein